MMPRTATKIVAPAALRAKHVGFVLPNGVRCIIVQDPNAKVPAAAMSIATGQLSDPTELPGLAHFCEHMLFMGTEKFPKEGEYDSFVSKNNGHNNAYTAGQATVYYFQVSDTALEGALARFVEFFVAPTFNESAVNREVQAVHSEDEKNHSSDYWRSDEIFRGQYNDKHPRSRYTNGNATTLVDEPKEKGINLREELKKFYAANYAAEGACIAICSARDPETVMNLIEEPLLRMRPGKGPSFHFIPEGESLFKPEVAGSWMNIKTLKKSRSVRVQWPVRSPSTLWKSMPEAYISHILGHECDTSVLGVLKQRDWATGMVAGASRVDDDYQLFYAQISLTVEGFSHIPEVIGILYEYIGLAVSSGVNEAVYAQMKAEERLSFESEEISSPSNHCVGLAQNVALTDLAHCFIGGSCVLEDNLDATLAYAKQLTPDAAQVTLMWGSLPSAVVEASGDEAAEEANEEGQEEVEDDEEAQDKEEDEVAPEKLFAALPGFAQKAANTVKRFHKAQFSEVRIPEEHIAAWRAALADPKCPGLALPSTNPFITTDFTVFPSTDDVAVAETFNSPHGVTMIRKDANHHSTFKCSIRWSVISPIAYSSALNRIYTQVMGSIIEASLTELSYYGELASLDNAITKGAGGPGFEVTGPYQNLATFFTKVVGHALTTTTLQGTKEKFDTYRELYIRGMQGVPSIQPYKHAVQRLNKAVCLYNYTFEDILASAPSATYDGYKAFAEEFLRSGLLFECFIAGNMPSAQEMANTIANAVEEMLTKGGVPVPDKSTITRFRDFLDLSPSGGAAAAPADTMAVKASIDVISLPPFNMEDPNVTALLDVYIGKTTTRTWALCSVSAKVFSSLFFNALRTKEALGYIVFSQYRPIEGGSHMVFAAQSAVADVDGVYLVSRIVAFLEALEGRLTQLCTDEELQKIAGGLIQGLEKLPDSVAQDASHLASEYLSTLGPDYRPKLVAELKKITASDVLEFFNTYILNDRTGARGLALVVDSNRVKDSNLFTKGAAGDKVIPFPVQRKGIEATDDASAPTDEADLVLPTFEGDAAAAVAVTVFSGLAEYRKDRPVVRDHTF